ncbi:MAG: sigma-70 family RNA polymerase sigma factor [Firmicutes bacterium]|nr:sigma-70 family RNA polymerase sigma factor [Alicyclobacillaceae bacterium]MCL6497347.1 sigma-70 family RNA polymerase sigma factor [Bacillota bacterium]
MVAAPQRPSGNPRLAVGRERDLVVRAQQGDRAAWEELVEKNLPLVAWVARGYRHGALSWPDLVQEGSLGLLEAIRRFDPDRSNHLSTYAVWWIRQAVNEEARRQRRVQAVWGIGRTGGEEGAAGEPIPEGYPNGTGEPPDLDPYEAFDAAFERAILRRALSRLEPVERYVLARRFGLGEGGARATYGEIGAVLRRSPEQVRRVCRRALEKLRRMPEVQHLRAGPEDGAMRRTIASMVQPAGEAVDEGMPRNPRFGP